MTRDYITYELQEALSRINNLNTQEQAIEDARQQRDGQRRRDAEQASQQAREALLHAIHSPSAIYQFLAATEEADATAFRTQWQNESQKVDYLRDQSALRSYYLEHFESPKIDLAILPTYSFILQFTFTLAQPYISRDEQDFYIIDNPVRKDKVFGLPYIASTSWKGSLRAALWQLDHDAKDKATIRLFGNEQGEEHQEKLHAGRLYFFPTFFTQKSLEIINPQNRKLRAGEKPIAFESVPIGTTGVFTLLYIPFDGSYQNDEQNRSQAANDLQLVTRGLQAMFRTYGFGAKTSSGFGLAKENVSAGTLKLRATGFEVQKTQEPAAPQHAAQSLPRYLEAPDRLKSEYLNADGTFRERPEVELKKMNKSDRQMYDKAKSWWEREGKQLAEAAKQPAVKTILPEPSSLAVSFQGPKWSFSSFERLTELAKEVVNKLSAGGAA